MHNSRYASASRHSRTRWWGLAAVLLSTAGLGLAYGIGYTVTSLRLDSWGAPGWLVGLAGAAPSLAVVLLVPLVPRLAARLGTVPTMVAGGAIVGATFLLMPVLEGTWWWVLLRFVSDLGLTLPWLVGETWINTVVPDRVRGRVLALYAMLLFTGWAVGPVVLERTGTEVWSPYLVGTAATLLMCVPLLAARRLAPAVPAHQGLTLRGAVALAPLAMAAAAVGGVAEFGWISLLPSYALDAGTGTSLALRLLTAFLVGGLLLQLAVGWLADRLDRLRLLGSLGVALAVTSTLFALAVARGPVAVLAAALLGGVAMGFYAVGLTVLGERVPATSLATANGAFLVSYEAGATVGPVAGGVALDVWPPHGLVVLVAIVGVVLAAGVRVVRRRPEPGPAPVPCRA
ncbi:MFS transporter [Aquipuribacter nitratireducens]|uniref:MFS transporter n=1 Tax=Aquipuribacter nitratireducens TaxID=650104 RepID=A0ABW0GN67_9MICO